MASILDDLGEEVTGIAFPVSLCMALTVLLVKLLNPKGESNREVVLVATAVYDEQVLSSQSGLEIKQECLSKKPQSIAYQTKPSKSLTRIWFLVWTDCQHQVFHLDMLVPCRKGIQLSRSFQGLSSMDWYLFYWCAQSPLCLSFSSSMG